MGITENVRYSNIDLVKFICAFGVICIHTQNSTFQADLIGDFFLPLCVPFFYLSALVFFVSGLKTIDLPVIANKIWTRIIIPYLFWTVIYFSLIMIKHHFSNIDISNQWWRILFYGCSAVQLYYIPKMLILHAFSLSVMLFLNRDHKRKLIGFIIFLVALGWLFYGIKSNCLGFNADDCVTTPMYLFFGFKIAKLKDTSQLDKRYFIFGLGLFISLLILKYGLLDYLAISTFYVSTFFDVLSGLSLTLLTFSLPPIFFPKKVVLIFGFSYGIFLCHILFLEAFEFILQYLGIDLFYTAGVKLIFSLFVLCSSILFVFLVKQNRVLKKILIGE